MADLRGEQLKDSYQNVVTRGTGNKLENGNGVEFADLDDKASLSAINNDPNFYEEGTWTPVYTFSSGSVTYNTQSGSYIRIGNHVFCTGFISVDTISSPSGSILQVSGLPFVRDGDFNVYVGRYSNWSSEAPKRGNQGGDTVINLRTSGATDAGNFPPSNLAADCRLWFSFDYKTT